MAARHKFISETKEGTPMSRANGDKSRHHRERRRKLARRIEMRALRKALVEKSTAAPAAQE